MIKKEPHFHLGARKSPPITKIRSVKQKVKVPSTMTRARRFAQAKIEHSEYLTAKPRRLQDSLEIAQRTANWTFKKYKHMSLYMMFHTHEVTEGYLQEYYPQLTKEQETKILELAGVLIQRYLND